MNQSTMKKSGKEAEDQVRRQYDIKKLLKDAEIGKHATHLSFVDSHEQSQPEDVPGNSKQ